MTDREKAIVMAYTGYAMLTGDKLGIYYKYIEDILGHKESTHKIYSDTESIRAAAYKDFVALCRESECDGCGSCSAYCKNCNRRSIG